MTSLNDLSCRLCSVFFFDNDIINVETCPRRRLDVYCTTSRAAAKNNMDQLSHISKNMSNAIEMYVRPEVSTSTKMNNNQQSGLEAGLPCQRI